MSRDWADPDPVPCGRRQRSFVRIADANFTADQSDFYSCGCEKKNKKIWHEKHPCKSLGQLKFSSKTDPVIDGGNVLLWSYSASN